MRKAEVRSINTPYGEGRLHVRRATSPVATLLLSHGAGRGIDAPDLEALAQALPGNGVSVMLFEQPWHVAGRKIATPPATLDAGLTAAADAMRGRTPLVVGGRSAGARSGARCAKSLGARGVLALSFPLHPPGRPEKSRVEELRSAGLPILVVQGERDAMGRPDEFPDDVAGLDLTVIPEADHGLKVPKRAEISQAEALGIVVESTLEWLVRDIAGVG
ncbi:alpha/beta family hydrolase [Nocardioides piscis]|uniref:Hydrolase n=1 Tax=Nocardioides piscis TaxID=2714938 RepID=A0A6G7YG45_9ACTN|nr:alpha/beta family hydrolase [Nocardioides piscis]QIK75874.1 hydrolase [Nocardioides piscis]